MTRGSPPAWKLGEELVIPHRKKSACCGTLHRASDLAGSSEHDNETSDSIKGRKFSRLAK
jgi:hypothetical protein